MRILADRWGIIINKGSLKRLVKFKTFSSTSGCDRREKEAIKKHNEL